MDWIHCNICFIQPGQTGAKKPLFLTSCGHMYCELCVEAIKDKVCKICGISFTIIPLDKNMKPDVQDYFKDVESMHKKASEVAVFQNDHRQRFARQNEFIRQKYTAAKEEVKKMYEINRALQKKLQEQDLALKFYKKKAEENQPQPPCVRLPGHGPLGRSFISSSTPRPSGGRPPLTNLSHMLNQYQGSASSISNVTPNRLTLHYKSQTPEEKINPSPDSSITPSRCYRNYRNVYPYPTQQSTPSSGYSSGTFSRYSSGPERVHRTVASVPPRQTQYYDTSVPSRTPPNIVNLSLNSRSAPAK